MNSTTLLIVLIHFFFKKKNSIIIVKTQFCSNRIKTKSNERKQERMKSEEQKMQKKPKGIYENACLRRWFSFNLCRGNFYYFCWSRSHMRILLTLDSINISFSNCLFIYGRDKQLHYLQGQGFLTPGVSHGLPKC